jgi:hypothetical protein
MVKTKNPIAMQAADKSDAVHGRGDQGRESVPRFRPDPAEDLPPKVKDLLTNRLDKTVFLRSDRGRITEE